MSGNMSNRQFIRFIAVAGTIWALLDAVIALAHHRTDFLSWASAAAMVLTLPFVVAAVRADSRAEREQAADKAALRREYGDNNEEKN